MANIVYIIILSAVIGYGFYSHRRNERMIKAVLKQTSTDDMRWTATQRAALMQPTAEERERRELERARIKWDMRTGRKDS